MAGSTGRELGRLPLWRPLDDGTPALTMKRSRLTAALVGECRRRGIEVHHDSRVVGAEERGGGVTATIADGRSERADVLVAPTGCGRRCARGSPMTPPSARYVGLTNVGGITRGAAA